MLAARTIRMAVLTTLLCGSAAAQAKWHEVTTDHFIIVGDASPSRLTDKAERLEAVHDLMRRAYGLPEDGVSLERVRVLYTESAGEMQRIGHMGDYVGGYYRPRMEGAIAVVPLESNGKGDGTLFHEYAHHFMLQYVPAAYPSWYVEGAAEVIGQSSFERKGAITYGKAAEGRQYEMEAFNWIPLSDLMTKTFNQVDDASRFRYYGEAWLLTHYLTFDPTRSQQLRRYLATINSGRDPKEALAVFGDLKALDRDAQKYERNRSFEYKAVPIGKTGADGAKVRALTDAEAALTPLAFEFTTPMPTDEAKAFAEKVRGAVARHPNDPYALSLLFEVEDDLNNTDAGEAVARRWLAVEPDGADAHAALGRALLARWRGDAGKTEAPQTEEEADDAETVLVTKDEDVEGRDAALLAQAREALERSVSTGRASPVAKVSLWDSYAQAGETPPEPVIKGLVKAMEAVPQVSSVRFRVAQQLIAEGATADAIYVLRPVAYNPHGGSAAKAALAMIQRAQGASATADTEPDSGS